jgi:hypothetical protein
LTNGNPGRERTLSIASTIVVTLLTLVGLEIFLRVADFRELRETLSELTLGVDYDVDLGWAPKPGSTGTIQSFRTTHYKHNSLGLRDEEFVPDARPTILFVGDSFVWGLDSEADERFSDLLKRKLPNYQIQAAGASGYATDQEFLLVQRLWPTLKPAVVVLIFCASNDRQDNDHSRYYASYHKPYFATQPDGSIALKGQPVPKSQLIYYRDNWLVHNLWLARIANNVYIRLMHPIVIVPDPTEKIVGKMRDYVEANGGKFMVGIQHHVPTHDEPLARYLEANRIPYVSLIGADPIPPSSENVWGPHWTPKGQADVAERIYGMFAANGVVRASAASTR